MGTSYVRRPELMKSYVETLEKANEPNRQFCTRFIGQIYHQNGVSLVSNPDYCSPKDIEESESLEKVENILRLDSKAEIELALEDNPLPEQMAASTFYFFEKVRNLTGEDIQNFIQLERYLLGSSKYCLEIGQILTDSGYLEMGDKEKANNPTVYDYELFCNAFPFEIRLDVSFRNIYGELIREQSYERDMYQCIELFNKTQCQYFKIQADCAKRQLELSRERKLVFQKTIDDLI